MLSVIDGIFFFYMFIGLYMSGLFLFLYLPNRNKLYYYPKGKAEPVSIIVPCYNAEKNIGKTIEALLGLNYPKEMIEIIIVDDKSTDGSLRVVESYLGKYKNVRLIKHSKNCGNAAGTTNTGIRHAKYKYIAVADDDSIPDKDNLIKMIGFLQEDKNVGGVTCSVLTQKASNFLQKLQVIEYRVIAFNRKLLDMVDSVYVTPGPFALYRKDIIVEIGMFDEKNMTQDIEIVWRMLARGYKAKMCLDAKVYSTTPTTFKAFWRQRTRWNMGGLQCMIKYKKYFLRHGMLGYFVLPFFSISLFLGMIGLGLFTYLLGTRGYLKYLATKLSLGAGVSIISPSDFTFTPTILNFFGITLFAISLVVTNICLYYVKDKDNKTSILSVIFYMLVYLMVYPFIMTTSLYRSFTKKYSW